MSFAVGRNAPPGTPEVPPPLLMLNLDESPLEKVVIIRGIKQQQSRKF